MNTRAYISLTFDDGVPSQIENAIPLLNKYNLRGTFFLKVGTRGLARPKKLGLRLPTDEPAARPYLFQ